MSRPRKTLSTNGAVKQATGKTVQDIVETPTPVSTTQVNAQKQTHGAYTPIVGGITNVSQLLNRGRNIAKGSAGSFETMEAYSQYLQSLSLHDLHDHAVRDARVVPIDDRTRLIRRLETAWTATGARFPGRANPNPIPRREPFSQAQIEAQEKIRRELLKR